MNDVLINFDVTDVMEFVAAINNTAEPAQSEASNWLLKHYGPLNDALEAAFKDYVRAHWRPE